MTRWRSAAHSSVVLVLLCGVLGCQSGHPRGATDSLLRNTVPTSVQVPATVQRLAVLHPKTLSRELMDAYARLEGAAFIFKEQRPGLRIVDRSSLSEILDEQRFQTGGSVSDDTAIRLGRLLGVDSVLLYRIEGPARRDWLFARSQGDVPPYVVTSKIIMVESAEVVFHNVVTAPVDGQDLNTSRNFDGASLSLVSRATLDRGVAQTIEDLRHAFRSLKG
ncbi:MAG: hypothetical protein ACE5MM_08105 [Nitrospiraceae bacterium]